MKRALFAICLVAALIAFVVPSASAESKASVNVGAKGLIGPDLSAYALLGEYEMIVRPNLSVFGRLGYLSYEFDDDVYEEEGDGPGVEVGVRYYPRGGLQGFYVGGNIGLWWTEWDWKDDKGTPFATAGDGESTALDVAVEVGGRIPLGSEKFVLIPNAQIGNYFSIQTDSKFANGADADKETEMGFYGLVGLSLGFSF